MQRPLFLISNDDGYLAKGFNALIQALIPIGDVVAIAPEQSQSGTSHALTLRFPLRIALRHDDPQCKIYSCNGTPVDCVKFALKELVPRKPDLLLSGINHGENASSSALYSGTMAAAMEGCMYDIPAIGFSLLNHDLQAHFSPYIPIVKKVIEATLQHGLQKGVCLNVNIPYVPIEQILGIRLCRLAQGYWEEIFDKRKDPDGRTYYWFTGYFVNEEQDAEDTDEWALAHRYVSIVPTHIDMTAHRAMKDFDQWELFQ